MKFKDFQASVLFASTFKALNLGEKIQVLSRTFKDAWETWVQRSNFHNFQFQFLTPPHDVHLTVPIFKLLSHIGSQGA